MFGLMLFVSAALALWLGHSLVPRILLALLTKGRVKSRNLQWIEVYEEIGAELKARRLVAEVRREAAARKRREETK